MTDAKFRGKSEAAWTKDRLDKDTRINEHQLEFMLWVEQYFLLNERLPDYDTTCEHLNITPEQWREYWTYPPLREALLTRGIHVRLPTGAAPGEQPPEGEALLAPLLTGPQLELVNELLNFEDTRPDHKKLSDAGISKQQYQSWLADPVFNSYLTARVGKLEIQGALDADRALIDGVRSGDIKAIQYFNEKTGRYRPQDPQTVNFTLMVNQIIDIIIGNINPEQAQLIGGQIIAAVNNAGISYIHPGVSAAPPVERRKLPDPRGF